MKKYLLFFTLLIPAFSQAYIFHPFQTKRICNVQYETEDGWSKQYTLEIDFRTGIELNKGEPGKYSDYSVYALIWFQEGGVAILEISNTSYLSFGNEFDHEDFVKLFPLYSYSPTEAKQINGDKGKRWKITAVDSGKYIDPRVNQ